jgi:hypothetical protein
MVPHCSQNAANLLTLPNKVIEIIAIHLYFADKIRSLASFGQCSKRLRVITELHLWKNVTWAKVDHKHYPSGWQAVE